VVWVGLERRPRDGRSIAEQGTGSDAGAARRVGELGEAAAEIADGSLEAMRGRYHPRQLAGEVLWLHGSLPSFKGGFNSRRPLGVVSR
jgi:hypothetical protein